MKLDSPHICYGSEDYSVTDTQTDTWMATRTATRTLWIIEDLLILKIKILILFDQITIISELIFENFSFLK